MKKREIEYTAISFKNWLHHEIEQKNNISQSHPSIILYDNGLWVDFANNIELYLIKEENNEET
jgi:hypothetical protein